MRDMPPTNNLNALFDLKLVQRIAENTSRSAKVDLAMLHYFQEARDLRIRKEMDYGSSWRELGAKGLFVRITDKVKRLFSLLWQGNEQQVKDESIRDTALDLVNYGLFLLYAIDHEMLVADNPAA